MLGDFSNRTTRPVTRYSGVVHEQARLLTDADLDEEHRILAGVHEIVTADVIGPSGGPLDGAGFEITVGAGGDLEISAGRYYVDGILVENDMDVALGAQPYPSAAPSSAVATLPDGTYPVVLDVWRRLVTALDDPSLREVALGGPTTASREHTVWQARLLPLTPNWTCAGPVPAETTTTGTLTARARPEAATKTPCLVPALSGFSGLENHFYRVEALRGGAALDVTAAAVAAVTPKAGTSDQFEMAAAAAKPGVGDFIELVRTNAGADPFDATFSQVTGVNGSVVTITTAVPALLPGETLGLRIPGPIAVMSRENGSVVTGIERIDGRTVTVSDLGPDEPLGFGVREWVEVTDDLVEFADAPVRRLSFITEIDVAARTITLATPVAALSTAVEGVDPLRHPKLRRWDGAHGIWYAPAPDNWLHVENGIEVSFAAGNYRPSDYWWFAARTAVIDDDSGNIEWQQSGGLPASLPPMGIERHRAGVALVTVAAGVVTVSDCRTLFPPLTAMTNLFYVGGDGQEARRHDTGFPTLPEPLVVRVANGEIAVPGVPVRFSPDGGAAVDVLTDADGIAEFTWTLTPPANTASPVPPDAHVCTAHLVDAASSVIANQVVRFTATVQDLTTLLVVGGDGQEVRAQDQGYPRLGAQLVVRVANGAHPVQGAVVEFTPAQGAVAPGAQIVTGADGLAAVDWTLDPQQQATQTVVARLIDTDGAASAHQQVQFHARLGEGATSGHVGCCTSVGPGGEYETIEEAIMILREKGFPDICLCMLPGDHKVGILGVEGEIHLSIRGCGRTTRVYVEDRFDFRGLLSLRLADLDLIYPDRADDKRQDEGILFIEKTPQVRLDNVHVFGRSGAAALVTIRGAVHAMVIDSVLQVPATRRHRRFEGLFDRLSVVAANNSVRYPTLSDVVTRFEGATRAAGSATFAEESDALITAVSEVTPAARRRLAETIRTWSVDEVHEPGLAVEVERIASAFEAGGERLENLPVRVETAALVVVDSAAEYTSGLVALEIGPNGDLQEFEGPPAEITVRDNLIYGDASFYGLAARPAPDPEEGLRSSFGVRAREGSTIGGAFGTVHVTGNHLGKLRVSEQLLALLLRFAVGKIRHLELYRSFLVSNNVFDGFSSDRLLDAIVAGRQVVITGNHFTAGASGELSETVRVLDVAALSAAAGGNIGEVSGQIDEKTGNLDAVEMHLSAARPRDHLNLDIEVTWP